MAETKADEGVGKDRRIEIDKDSSPARPNRRGST